MGAFLCQLAYIVVFQGEPLCVLPHVVATMDSYQSWYGNFALPSPYTCSHTHTHTHTHTHMYINIMSMFQNSTFIVYVYQTCSTAPW